MKTQLSFFVLCFVLLCPIASAGPDGEAVINSLRWVESADPIKNAELAIEAKDYRFLGISGRGVNVPGLPEGTYWLYTNKYGINVMKGTSDIVWGEEHRRLIEIATKYAELYNKRLLQALPVLQPSNNAPNSDAR